MAYKHFKLMRYKKNNICLKEEGIGMIGKYIHVPGWQFSDFLGISDTFNVGVPGQLQPVSAMENDLLTISHTFPMSPKISICIAIMATTLYE